MLRTLKLIVLVGIANGLTHSSNACEPSPLLIDANVIIVEGRPHIVTQKTTKSASSEERRGTAVIKPKKILANKTRARPPFQFEFHSLSEDGCLWGSAPIEGFLIRAYLRASENHPKILVLLSFEHLELGVPSKDRRN